MQSPVVPVLFSEQSKFIGQGPKRNSDAISTGNFVALVSQVTLADTTVLGARDEGGRDFDYWAKRGGLGKKCLEGKSFGPSISMPKIQTPPIHGEEGVKKVSIMCTDMHLPSRDRATDRVSLAKIFD